MDEPCVVLAKEDSDAFYGSPVSPSSFDVWLVPTDGATNVSTRCPGFEIIEGSGDYSGCAIGDGASPDEFPGDMCPVCHNTGVV